MTGKRRTVPQTIRWDQLAAEHTGHAITVRFWWDPGTAVPFTFDHTDREVGGGVPGERDEDGAVTSWQAGLIHYLRWPDGTVGGVNLPADSQVELL